MDKQECYVIEKIKKSKFAATDFFDYKKLEQENCFFLPCKIDEEKEELIFTYMVEGYQEAIQLGHEEVENQYQFLMNFPKLKETMKEFKVELTENNIYYDENYLPVIKNRDIYPKEEAFREEGYLYQYKCFVGGTLHKKYTIQNVKDSGIEILRKNKFLQSICDCETDVDISNILREKKKKLSNKRREEEMSVNKKLYLKNKIFSRISIVILTLGICFTGYYTFLIGPKRDSIIVANQAYIRKDYVKCIDAMGSFEIDQMDKDSKYILAISYTQGETFKKEEINSILAKLSPDSDEKELNYWIYLGRLHMDQAQDIAISLSDDKLLIYAYMKEASMVESDTTISGAEKSQRLQQLENDIENLGKKYQDQVAETQDNNTEESESTSIETEESSISEES